MRHTHSTPGVTNISIVQVICKNTAASFLTFVLQSFKPHIKTFSSQTVLLILVHSISTSLLAHVVCTSSAKLFNFDSHHAGIYTRLKVNFAILIKC